MEIERKWMVNGFPCDTSNVRHIDKIELIQYFLTTEPVVRVQYAGWEDGRPNYYLDVKSGSGLVRTEVSIPITKEQYEELTSLIKEPPIIKDYRTYKLKTGELLEVSEVDKGTDTHHFYAEIEFNSVDEANRFPNLADILPELNPQEVTGNAGVSMAEYWDLTRRNNDNLD